MSPFFDMFLHKYPNTDLHELNLDAWVIALGETIQAMKEVIQDQDQLRQEMNTFKAEILEYIHDLDIPQMVVTEVDNYLDEWVTALTSAKLIGDTDWKNRVVLWAGDSYGNGWDGSHTAAVKPYVLASITLGVSQYYDVSHGGCRFGAGDTSLNYLTYIQNWVSLHTQNDCDSITDVIVIGGANDITHNPNEDLNDASNPGSIRNTVSYIRQHFPNARVIIGMIARLANTGASGATLSNTDKVRNSYRNGALANSAIYLEGGEYINHDYRLLASDGIHLTSYSDMGDKIAELLATGNFTRWYGTPTAVNYQAVGSDSGSQLIPTNVSFGGQRYRGHSIMIDLNDVEFNRYDNPISSIGWGSIYKFAEISGSTSTRNSFCAGDQSFRERVVAAVEYTGTDSETHKENLPGSIYLYNNALYFSIEGFVPSGTSSIHIPNVEYIRFKGGCQFFLDEAFC